MRPKEKFQNALAIIFILGFFLMAWLLRNTPDKDGVIETLKMGVVLILGYFFGSSKGSADKSELLNQNSKP